MAKILIAGDLMPHGINEAPFRDGDLTQITADLAPAFDAANLVIANLEVPLIDAASPVAKSGPVLGSPSTCVRGITAAGIDVLSLANNHIMDHGPRGLDSTIRVCEQAGLSHVGAGPDLSSAKALLVREVEGLKIGILAYAENEFGMADRTHGGACPLDATIFVPAILAARAQCDTLLVILHGGNEFHPWPRPSLQSLCRLMVDLGADFVTCQHSHIAGCHEQYSGGLIVYGQGNFISDATTRPPFWHEGILVEIEVRAEGLADFRTIPFRQSSDGIPGIRTMDAARKAAFLQEIEIRSEELRDPAIVEQRWNAFCESRRMIYLRRFGALHRAFRLLDRLTGYIQYLITRRRMRLEQINMIRCESHREVLINLLSKDSGRSGD